MGIPNATHQVASNAIAALGKWISLHTAAAGTTGANEASGGSYTRAQTSSWTPDGVGDNTGAQVNVLCAAGTYQEGGIFTTQFNNQLSIPSGVSANGLSTGGTFAAGTYYWKVCAGNFSGQTLPSLEVSATLSGTTSSASIAWSSVSGATIFYIYRGSTSSGENVLVGTATGTSFTDTGAAGTAATVPVTNTASTFIGSNSFVGGSVTVSGTGASINVSPSITV